MTKYERRILRLLISIAPNEDDKIWIDYENNKFRKIQASKESPCEADFSCYQTRIKTILRGLEKKECISFIGELRQIVRVKYEGYYFRWIQWEEVKAFLLKSVLVPIAVSVLTTLAINLTPHLLQRLL